MMDESAKVLLYNLGVACEGAGKLDKAHENFKRIYETDIGFKDVSEKIESVYEKAKKEKEANANQ